MGRNAGIVDHALGYFAGRVLWRNFEWHFTGWRLVFVVCFVCTFVVIYYVVTFPIRLFIIWPLRALRRVSAGR